MLAAISVFNRYTGEYNRWFSRPPAICRVDEVTALLAAAVFPVFFVL